MSQHTPPTDRRTTVNSILVVLLATSFVLVCVLTLQAREMRRNAAAAADLRLAVLAVAPVQDTSELDPASRSLFVHALDLWDSDLEPALVTVEPDLRPATSAALEDLRQHGLMLRHGIEVEAPTDTTLADRWWLQDTLRTSSIRAAEEANSAETRAAVGAFVFLVIFATAAGSHLRSLARAQGIRVTAEAYRTAADRFGALLEHGPEATAVIDADGQVTYASQSMHQLLGAAPHTRTDFLSLGPEDPAELLGVLQNTGSEPVKLDLSTMIRGAEREFRVRVTNLVDDRVVNGHLVSVSETTQVNRNRRQLEYLAGHDQLTSLPNRRSLLAALNTESPSALLMIDLDDFKSTNDALGHGAGDELLVAIAQRFALRLGDRGRIFRLGGDEFAATVHHKNDDAEAIGRELLGALAQPISLSAGVELASASIGVATGASTGSGLPLLRRADIALYEAKRRGGDSILVIDEVLEKQALLTADLVRSFETADFDEEFDLAFQPIVHATTYEPVLVEALARWTSPTHGPVSPDEFIPIAEASGRIGALGEWVLDQALAHLAVWKRRGLVDDLVMSVNVSALQLVDTHFADRVITRLRTHGIAASSLVLELTESSLVDDDDVTRKQLERLHEFGCSIACDDFGSGYSNLGQLMRMPLTLIKVDRALLLALERDEVGRNVDRRPGDPYEVMSAISTLGDAIGAAIVAEGVETDMQATSMQRSGVDLLQGYHFGRPMYSSEFTAALAHGRSLTAVAP